MNVTRDDLIALSGLDEIEVGAISDHEGLPESIAAALGQSAPTFRSRQSSRLTRVSPTRSKLRRICCCQYAGAS